MLGEPALLRSVSKREEPPVGISKRATLLCLLEEMDVKRVELTFPGTGNTMRTRPT